MAPRGYHIAHRRLCGKRCRQFLSPRGAAVRPGLLASGIGTAPKRRELADSKRSKGPLGDIPLAVANETIEDLLSRQARKGDVNIFSSHRAFEQVAQVLVATDCEGQWYVRHFSTCSRSDSTNGNGFQKGFQSGA